MRKGTDSIGKPVVAFGNGEQVERMIVASARGWFLTRAILDPQDRVILNGEELMTHWLIDTARQAGALDILRGSVYDKDPEIAMDELRVPARGKASLAERERNPIPINTVLWSALPLGLVRFLAR